MSSPVDLAVAISVAERRLSAHAPDPASGWCLTCRTPGVCGQYWPLARALGDLRRERDADIRATSSRAA
ncbi:hypothetical protein Afil01_69330 [Actinorhabdospora filicis]|uniref:Uncharacterized protein n=1 Tax=Actinorhabdospora filicis TaxID=1785913 RepID=A0A9W6STB6_9ACTN|nr:hypothetical protein [Actinorhabdospora filicis]GLZ82126.1 hypothetical protein Afil01_69330 [Actinorhabdospora filicis]